MMRVKEKARKVEVGAEVIVEVVIIVDQVADRARMMTANGMNYHKKKYLKLNGRKVSNRLYVIHAIKNYYYRIRFCSGSFNVLQVIQFF